MTLQPDPDDPRRPMFPLRDAGSWRVVPLIVVGLALFVTALLVLR